jgi:dihydroxy-acid dehydratase
MTTGPNPLAAPEPRRAAARAMLKAVGFSDADLLKPLIGVANTWIEIGPCNYHLRDLAVHVKEGIRAAGGTPMEFNTVSISDGITMNTEGMKASLVSREVMADSIELVARGNGFDGVIVLVGCDKTIPAGVMALARLNTPGLVLYGGSIAPGHWHGKDVTIQDVFEAVGAQAAGKMTLQDLQSLESAACPGAGACGGQFTANTMAMAVEFLGIAALGSGSVPATHAGKAGVARVAGERVMSLVKNGSRRSPPAAARPMPCCIYWRLRGKPAWSSRSRISTASAPERRFSPISSRRAGSSRTICTPPAAARCSRDGSSTRSSSIRRRKR